MKLDTLLGFYVELKHKAGHAIHSFYPKLLDITYLPLSTCLLKPHKIEDAHQEMNSTSNNGAAINYLHGRFGKFVNLIKVAYLGRKTNGKLDSTKDEIEIMMGDFVNSDEISFISLSDVSATDFFDSDAQVNSDTSPDDTVTISTFKLSPRDDCYTKIKNNMTGTRPLLLLFLAPSLRIAEADYRMSHCRTTVTRPSSSLFLNGDAGLKLNAPGTTIRAQYHTCSVVPYSKTTSTIPPSPCGGRDGNGRSTNTVGDKVLPACERRLLDVDGPRVDKFDVTH